MAATTWSGVKHSADAPERGRPLEEGTFPDVVGLVDEGLFRGHLQGVHPGALAPEGDEDLPVACVLREVASDAPHEGLLDGREPEEEGDLVHRRRVGLLVEEDLHGGVIEDGVPDDGGRDNVGDLLGDDGRAGVVLPRGLPQRPQVIRRPLGRDGLPGLLDEKEAEGVAPRAHLALEGVYDAEGAEGVEGRVRLRDGIHLEDRRRGPRDGAH